MGQTTSRSSGAGVQPYSNFVSSGHSVYVNEKGETVTDSFQHVNGEFVRQTETGKLPASGGFVSQSSYVPAMVATVATVFLVLSIFILYTKQRKQGNRARNLESEVEKNEVHSIPLYSLNKPRTHASDAMWNIDLLDEAE